MLARRLSASATGLDLVGALRLMAGHSAGIDRALQGVDGLTAVEHARELTAEGVVQEVVAQENSAKEPTQVYDGLVEWIAARR